MNAALRWVWLGTVPYRDAWSLQQRLAAARRGGAIDDVVLLLEHPPVYTVGRNSDARHLGEGADSLIAAGAECLDVDRGGSVTFHGPGQLVAYPIVRLAEVFPIHGHSAHGDVHRYLRALEHALIATASAFGVRAQRRPPYTGVWSGNRKLAAIGVKLAGGVTTHGLAINIRNDLTWFDRIVPCGIEGAGVASLQALGARSLTPETVAPLLAMRLAAAFNEQLFEADGVTTALVTSHLDATVAA